MKRVEQLLIVVQLLRHIVIALFLLRHHIHEEGHIITEHVAYLVNGVVGVFHHIVQEGAYDGVDIQTQLLRRYSCHSHRVYNIRCATLAILILMGFLGKGIGFPHPLQVFLSYA